MIKDLNLSKLLYYFANITIIALIAISLNNDFESIDSSLPGRGGDAEQYFATAYNLAQYGVHDYDTTENPKPSNYREPIYPLTLGFFWKIIGLNDSFTYNCITNENSSCFYLVELGKKLNIFYKIIFLLFTYYILTRFNFNKIFSLGIVAFISFNPLTNTYLNSYLLDYFSSLMFLIASYCFYLIISKPKINAKICFFYGFIFSLLIMTKFVYFYAIYLLIFFVLVVFSLRFLFPKFYYASNYLKLFSLKNILIFSFVAMIIPTLWKARSYYDTGYFELSPRGSGSILQRLEHITMKDEEFKAGLWLYFYDSNMRDKKLSQIDPKYLSRYELSCNNAENWYCIHETGKGLVLKRLEPKFRNNNAHRMEEGISVLKENLGKHLKLTILFLERGTLGLLSGFSDRGLFNELYKYFFILAFIILPISLLYFILTKNINLLILSFPLIFHISIHSLLTHYEPRYNIIILNYLIIYFFISIYTFLKKHYARIS